MDLFFSDSGGTSDEIDLADYVGGGEIDYGDGLFGSEDDLEETPDGFYVPRMVYPLRKKSRVSIPIVDTLASRNPQLSEVELRILAEAVNRARYTTGAPEITGYPRAMCPDIVTVAKVMLHLEPEMKRHAPDSQVSIGYVGAADVTQGQMDNLSYWDGSSYVVQSGSGSFEVAGVTPKIDGIPALPIRISAKGEQTTLMWVYVDGHYRITAIQGYNLPRAESRDGKIYGVGTGPKRRFGFGNVAFELAYIEPVLLTDIHLLQEYAEISDGYILHVGSAEYRVKHHATVDLEVSAGHARNLEGVPLFPSELPPGVYEFGLLSHEMIKMREDKTFPNCSRKVKAISQAAVSGQLHAKIPDLTQGVTYAYTDAEKIWLMYHYGRKRYFETFKMSRPRRILLQDVPRLILQDKRCLKVLRGRPPRVCDTNYPQLRSQYVLARYGPLSIWSAKGHMYMDGVRIDRGREVIPPISR